MKAFILLFVLTTTIIALPTTFDLRVQPSLIRYADYSFKQEGTCIAHSWGQQLAQIVSNAASLQMKSKIRLSSQHLIQCISSVNEICHDAILQNIYNALDFIQNSGITTLDCIKNKLFEVPRTFCPRQCDAGYKFQYQIKAIITNYTDIPTFDSILKALTADQSTAAFVIIKVYDSMNYYSSENPLNLDQITSQNFGYRVGEIVGWRSKGEDVIVRLGSGQGWGYNGFGYFNVNKHKSVIVGKYTVKMLASQGMRMQNEKSKQEQIQ